MSHITRTGAPKSHAAPSPRSILTTMGMVFGVASVIAMLAIGEGANFEAQQQIQELSRTSFCRPSSLRRAKPAAAAGRYILNYGLT